MKNLLLKLPFSRRVIRRFSLMSYKERLMIEAAERPHYGYCIFQAAKLAWLLEYPKISVIEFGCGGGNGLIAAEDHISEVMKLFDVQIELYGFDIGSGLPCPVDYRDMPYYFKPGLYRMDIQSLEGKLKRAKLVIGDVRDTCATFFAKYNPAPIACMFHDLDFYSSTRAALTLLNSDATHILPRIFMYFDDIIGNSEMWTCNDYTGERLAIEEFNREQQSQKICKDYYLPLNYQKLWWGHHMYVYHNFMHPKYNTFIASHEQEFHENRIKLR